MTMASRTDILPHSLAPRGLSRESAAAYLGISPGLFDVLVKDGRMPAPKRINTLLIWDRIQLDLAFEALSDKEEGRADDDSWSDIDAKTASAPL